MYTVTSLHPDMVLWSHIFPGDPVCCNRLFKVIIYSMQCTKLSFLPSTLFTDDSVPQCTYIFESVDFKSHLQIYYICTYIHMGNVHMGTVIKYEVLKMCYCELLQSIM